MKISFKSLLLAAPGAFLIGCGPAKKPAVPQSSSEASPTPAVASASPADSTAASSDSASNGGGGGGGQRQRGGGGGWNRGGGNGGGGGGGGDRGAERMQRMATALNLTPEQSEKIKAVMESQRPAMDAIRNDTSLSREDRRAKMQELRKTTDPQIAAILTPEQKTKWDQERAQMGNRQGGGGGGGGGGNGGGNPPPPPAN